MNIITRWLISGLVILGLAYLLPGISVSGFAVALVAAFIIGLVNTFVRPIVLLLTLPINILTLGLFTLIVNTFMLLLAAAIVPGFAISSFTSGLIFGIALWAVNTLLREEKPELA